MQSGSNDNPFHILQQAPHVPQKQLGPNPPSRQIGSRMTPGRHRGDCSLAVLTSPPTTTTASTMRPASRTRCSARNRGRRPRRWTRRRGRRRSGQVASREGSGETSPSIEFPRSAPFQTSNLPRTRFFRGTKTPTRRSRGLVKEDKARSRESFSRVRGKSLPRT